MSKLRERGVYRLPNGRELIALSGLQGERLLYTTHEWEHYELPTHYIDDNGRLCSGGKQTAWGLDDLIDTGRTAQQHEALSQWAD